MKHKDKKTIFEETFAGFLTSPKSPMDYMNFIVASNRALRFGLSWHAIWEIVHRHVTPGQQIPDIYDEFLTK